MLTIFLIRTLGIGLRRPMLTLVAVRGLSSSATAFLAATLRSMVILFGWCVSDIFVISVRNKDKKMNIKFALIFLFLIIANPIKAESININEGAVTFILSINENGEVIDANIKNTEPDNVFDEDFLAEIKEIVMEMKFTPKIVNDKAVRFKGTKTFKFINGDKLKK